MIQQQQKTNRSYKHCITYEQNQGSWWFGHRRCDQVRRQHSERFRHLALNHLVVRVLLLFAEGFRT